MASLHVIGQREFAQLVKQMETVVNTQMELIEPARGRLGYNGVAIRDKGEMLSLTDMWEAGGSVESQKPYEWLRQDATKAFVECVGASLEEGWDLVQTLPIRLTPTPTRSSIDHGCVSP